MKKLQDRFFAVMSTASMGVMVGGAIATALIDRAAHPVDTYRDLPALRARWDRLSGKDQPR